MRNQMNWESLFLNGNPFDISPPMDSEDVIWAGMTKLKQRFNEIFQEAAFSSATQVVLNRGPYGGGKTHASLYFELEDNLPPNVTKETQVHSISIRLPKEDGNPAEDLYIDFLENEKLGMTRVQEIIHNVVTNLSETEALRSFHKVLGSEELARAFWLFGTEDTIEKQTLLRAYFLEGCTKTDLRKLGLARNISKAQDRFRIIAGVLQCLIGFDAGPDSSQHSRVCLWIDEMEDMIYFNSSQFRILSQGLREIIDLLPNFFTLFLNMSLAEPEEYDDFEVLLGRAVIDRVTNSIYFSELEIDESVQYVNELINNPRFRDKPLPEKLPQTYPFEAQALEMLVGGLEKRTPRDINKRCQNAINYAFHDKHFEIGDSIIDPAYVMKIEKSELDREIN